MGQRAWKERYALQRYSQILPEEELYLKNTSIHTAEIITFKVALMEIHKREDKRWVIYTESQSSMQSIKYNKENQIYDSLAELQTQDKKIILCKVFAHIGIKGNEEAVKAANKQ